MCLVDWDSRTQIIVDLRINETLQTGAVGNRTYRVGLHSVRLETAPTGLDCIRCGGKPHLLGLGENIELSNYFLKPHTVCATVDGTV